MSAFESYVRTLGQEIARTERLVDEFPVAEIGFRPHERSSDAQRLLWTFAVEARMVQLATTEGASLANAMVAAPGSADELIAGIKENHRLLLNHLKSLEEGKVPATVQFMTGPGKYADIPIMDFLWMMLFDHIHHRGQLSVYVRMTGGRVPSIYGPSADEKWN